MGKAFAAWLMVASAVAAPAMGPRQTVETALTRVVSVFQDTEPRADHRGEVRRIARQLFDFQEMTRRALSRHWATRTPAEQTEFVALFTELLERSYMSRLEGFAGEKLTFVGEAVDGTYATVKSKVLTQGRSETLLDYRLHIRDGRWRVYDVLVDGVSFVSTYRSQFDRVITAESYDLLVEKLRRKNADTAVAERAKRL
ncbi:MAG: hypothetical protein A3E31_05895 [Candidatus Rokubacteria bacterium RIFCSPHIGHO2_12_FULL_73_22]|nr:MAG: hypothetical protein A3D33_13915 [Candidatus Rokubacteria bacterium RIFCSPHIGHO2_02_FULL_73_26]OGL04564.1 MAG: hypothetical protein A3E31_05895 [Candidatus Rokubacteria bacterium RIFCSPHIGHO2_12_FULL_73_22]OGL11117.1 MAG: hypothetical protein A3I14_05540 [Candidatus Rokubacteria bacterium RIFCSPLOWO2_02_FULL_73_56]OGL28365.1 MAG: hypothetical protein A3G44_07090 [Candidatus Rokubacteria bacterium RIFCSPLOWO2_12_FULL_73_47]